MVTGIASSPKVMKNGKDGSDIIEESANGHKNQL